MENESQIKEYINNKNKDSVHWTLDSIKTEFDSLIGKEEKETKEWLKLFGWLKNDKNLLQYAELQSKEGNLKRWEKVKMELLELKLSVTCPYFKDFKAFLIDLKKWENDKANWWTAWKYENWKDDINGEFCGLSTWMISSYPYYKNSKTWVTWCSATAQMNGQNFWIDLPMGDAYNAWVKPWKWCLYTLPKDKENQRPSKSWPGLKDWEFSTSSNDSNFADIYVESKSNYWHRAIAFRDSTGQRYVLDPYTRVNGRLDNSPKRLQDYMQSKKIVKAHFYKSKWYLDRKLSYT